LPFRSVALMTMLTGRPSAAPKISTGFAFVLAAPLFLRRRPVPVRSGHGDRDRRADGRLTPAALPAAPPETAVAVPGAL